MNKNKRRIFLFLIGAVIVLLISILKQQQAPPILTKQQGQATLTALSIEILATETAKENQP